MGDIAPDAEARVLAALENARYQWRTVGGVSKEAQVPVETVLAVFAQNKDRVVRASVASSSGEPLYSTRDQIRKKAPGSKKLLGALQNRILG